MHEKVHFKKRIVPPHHKEHRQLLREQERRAKQVDVLTKSGGEAKPQCREVAQFSNAKLADIREACRGMSENDPRINDIAERLGTIGEKLRMGIKALSHIAGNGINFSDVMAVRVMENHPTNPTGLTFLPQLRPAKKA